MKLCVVFLLCLSAFGLSGCGGGEDYRATLAKCRADRSIALTPQCRDARAAAFRARFGARG
ncbi:hypothetical protein FHR90_002000 [Endobacter medicaginis]|jgi:hypothetical protein|uniref:Lipoprotein n=1 Tax=Endobacter medicaginis TaxID=1181271 RepID=A0A850NP96_9PROT|nr:hypothetical protein [Endobacter medicaginis]MBB3174164.1 hypothetical protein [Endobacter medicaginis]MCX5474208.1 hypothetical protein [Endobacter medicaginis]NVN31571.1 hypothetical protein [Endobacter medicaginis]